MGRKEFLDGEVERALNIVVSHALREPEHLTFAGISGRISQCQRTRSEVYHHAWPYSAELPLRASHRCACDTKARQQVLTNGTHSWTFWDWDCKSLQKCYVAIVTLQVKAELNCAGAAASCVGCKPAVLNIHIWDRGGRKENGRNSFIKKSCH